MTTKATHIITNFILLSILTVSITLQSNILLSWDLSWFLHITQQFLSGGNYVTSFMDINPPIILYLHIPVVLLAHWSTLSLVVSERLFIYLLGILSLLTCKYLMNTLFQQHEKIIKQVLLITLAVVFFLLPTYEFGHREHVFILLTMPYFWRMALWAEGKSISTWSALWIGLLAGIGFLVNIEFFLLFLGIELYVAIKRGSLKSLCRLDSLCVFLIFIAYIASVFLLTPAYIHVILPLVFFLYTIAFNFSWMSLLLNAAFISWLLATALLPFQIKHVRHRSLLFIFYILATGCVIQYLITEKTWYYHMLPTLSFTLMIFVFYLCYILYELRTEKDIEISKEWLTLVKAIFVFALIIMLPVKSMLVYSRAAFSYSNTPHNEINRIINYADQHMKGKTIYIFSTTVAPASTLINYSGVKLASHFSGIWMLPGILIRSHQHLSSISARKLSAAKRLLFHLVISDFIRYRPDYVLVHTLDSEDLPYSDTHPFHYISYFTQDKQFKNIWSHYHKVAQINAYIIYKRQ